MANKSKTSLEDLEKKVKELETLLTSIKSELSKLTGKEIPAQAPSPTTSPKAQSAPPSITSNIEGYIVEGTFDGQNMQGSDGKSYPVPANYASKSKLVPGDTLKLTVTESGQFIYKQIGPVPRKQLIGEVIYENGAYKVRAEGKDYNVLLASITYFKAEVGDSVSIVLPAEGEVNWAAIENVMTGADSEKGQINTIKIQEEKERLKKEAKEKEAKAKKPKTKPGDESYTIDEL